MVRCLFVPGEPRRYPACLMANPYMGSKSNLPTSSSFLAAAVTWISPLVWFGIATEIANLYAQQWGLMGPPFINMNKWAQGRVALVLFAAFIWTIVYFSWLFASRQLNKPNSTHALLLTWNVIIVIVALLMVYWQTHILNYAVSAG